MDKTGNISLIFLDISFHVKSMVDNGIIILLMLQPPFPSTPSDQNWPHTAYLACISLSLPPHKTNESYGFLYQALPTLNLSTFSLMTFSSTSLFLFYLVFCAENGGDPDFALRMWKKHGQTRILFVFFSLSAQWQVEWIVGLDELNPGMIHMYRRTFCWKERDREAAFLSWPSKAVLWRLSSSFLFPFELYRTREATNEMMMNIEYRDQDSWNIFPQFPHAPWPSILEGGRQVFEFLGK